MDETGRPTDIARRRFRVSDEDQSGWHSADGWYPSQKGQASFSPQPMRSGVRAPNGGKQFSASRSLEGSAKISAMRVTGILYLVGPTAVGKSEVEVELALHLRGEILTAPQISRMVSRSPVAESPRRRPTSQGRPCLLHPALSRLQSWNSAQSPAAPAERQIQRTKPPF